MKEEQAATAGLFSVIRKWWKSLAAFVILVTVTSLITALLLPKKYYSVSHLLPSNSVLQDKSRIFNPNIQHLYSQFGSSDDLDRLYAIATSRAMNAHLVDSFNLVKHYGVQDDPGEDKYGAIRHLKDLLSIRKSVNGELVIGVWDRDKHMAASIVNALVERLQLMFEGMLVQLNEKTLVSLSSAQNTRQYDSTTLRKAITEIELAMHSSPPAFAVVSRAVPANRSGKPRVLMIVMSTFLISLFLAVLSAIIAEKVR